jgi:hypothetical protein
MSVYRNNVAPRDIREATQPSNRVLFHPGGTSRLNEDFLGTTMRSFDLPEDQIYPALSYFHALANHDAMIDARGQLVFTTATHSLNVARAVHACVTDLDRYVNLGGLDTEDKQAIIELRERRAEVSTGALEHDALKQGVARSILQKPGDFNEEERRRVIMHAEGAPFIEHTELIPAEIINALIMNQTVLPKVGRFTLKSAMQASHHAFFGLTPAKVPLHGRVTEFVVPNIPQERYKWKSYPLHRVRRGQAELNINGEYVPMTRVQLVASLMLHIVDQGEAQWSLERPYKKESVPVDLIARRLRAVNAAKLYTRSPSQQKIIEGCIRVLESEIQQGNILLTSGHILLHGRDRRASV